MKEDVFERALQFATKKHYGQVRKFSTLPYILHPVEVATIVSTMSDDRELLAACVLHDTVEDTDATLEEIEELFGKRVSLIVMTETEEKRPELPPSATWELRKEETLLILQNTKDICVKMMWLGDKLSNVRSLLRMHQREGVAMWQHFNQKDPVKQEWYYRTIASYLKDLKDYPAYKEYVEIVDKIFAKENEQ